MPALLTSTSMRPRSARTRSTMRVRSACFVTSVGSASALPPTPRTSLAVRSPPSAFSSATTTSAPSRASSSAVARPMPWPPPVTMATLPASSLPWSLTVREYTTWYLLPPWTAAPTRARRGDRLQRDHARGDGQEGPQADRRPRAKRARGDRQAARRPRGGHAGAARDAGARPAPGRGVPGRGEGAGARAAHHRLRTDDDALPARPRDPAPAPGPRSHRGRRLRLPAEGEGGH